MIFAILQAQNLTVDRRTQWTTEFFTIATDTTINIMDYGVANDGSTNCSPAFAQILIDFPIQPIHIYFPPGTYLFNNSLQLRSNMIVSGAGADSTFLKFDGGGVNHFIQVNGTISSTSYALSSNFAKDDTYVVVTDVSSIQSGDLIKILEDDTGRITSAWSLGYLGQIVEVDTIIGNEIHFTTPLRMSFDLINNPRYIRINKVHHVGIECLSIERIDTTVAQTRNVDFNCASHCYVNGIKSNKTNFGHVVMSNSYNIHVTNSYFKDAHAYGGGGQGYGVVIQLTSGNCLVQNNIFNHLRHSILLQACVNGNIIGYNYSRDPYWTSFPANSAGDIAVHGNYPFMNLFEGNTVQNIVIDDSHGLNGPYNTFYRNRAELYGINMLNAYDKQNFIGNEITHVTFGFFNLMGVNHYSYGNNDQGTTVPTGTNLVTDTSLYLTPDNPYYGTIADLPLIGYPNLMNEHKILAQVNYESSLLADCDQKFLSDTTTTGFQTHNNNGFTLYPNPTSSMVFVTGLDNDEICEVYTVSGKLVFSSTYNQGIDITYLPPALYIIKVKTHCFRLVKMD